MCIYKIGVGGLGYFFFVSFMYVGFLCFGVVKGIFIGLKRFRFSIKIYICCRFILFGVGLIFFIYCGFELFFIFLGNV